MRTKTLLTTISFSLFLLILTPSTLASSRLDDAREVQQELLAGSFQSDRLADARGSLARKETPSDAIQPLVYSDGFISPTYGRFTSKFGWRNIGAGNEFHKGIDIANVAGTNIMAAAAGTITHSKYMGGYGNVVIIKHMIKGKEHATVYAHLSASSVSVGQQVAQGQTVGKMGNTGRSFGSHLHFEIHIGAWNGGRTNAVDPARFIKL